MLRLILFGVIIVVAIVIWAGKAAAGAVTGSEKLRSETVRSQTQKTMQTAARGVNWLNEQWEQAKKSAKSSGENPPFLALVIALRPDDHDGVAQAKGYFEEYAKNVNGLTRIDNSLDDGTDVRLVRLSIDVSGWSATALRFALEELRRAVSELEKVGRAAFAVRSDEGHNEVFARNGLC